MTDSSKIQQQARPDYITLVQITDTHIMENPEQTFDGLDTLHSLKLVLKNIQEHEEFDAVLVTGDLVHDPVDNAYARLANQLKQVAAPVYCIAGNHDDPSIMARNLNSGNLSTSNLASFEHWQVCMLNTWKQGTHGGRLPREELDFLDQTLSESSKHAMIVLHHPPVSIDSPWMDAMQLENPGDLFAIVDRHKQVRLIIWGHIHQEFAGTYNKVQLLATPSTCIQFTPRASQYSRDAKPPGYRRLMLHSTGKIETEIIRVNISGN